MIDFDRPVWLVIATLVGALILWCKEPPESLRVYKLSAITDRIPNEHLRYYVQLISFLVIGVFAALSLAGPMNVRQAFAAGLGWTAGLSSRPGASSPKKKQKSAP